MLKDLSPSDAAKMMQTENDLIIMDVREQWEYDLVHLPNAQLYPMSTFMSKLDFLKPDGKYLVYCHHGSRSMQVCVFLHSKGFVNLFNLNGGIEAYSSEVDKTLEKY